MNKKYVYAVLVSSLATILTACGGGGSSASGVFSGTTPTLSSNTNTGTNTSTNTNIVATTSPVATAFTTNISNNKHLNINRVVRPTGDIATQIQKALENTNKLRAEKGLKALKLDENLAAYAQMRAAEISVTAFGHTRANGEGALEPLTGAGWSGENVAGGYANADQTVLTQWRNSEAHYNNIIKANYETIGIGLVYDPNSQYKYYWVQIFGSGSITAPYEFVDANSPNAKPLTQIVVNNVTIPINLNTAGQWQQINTNGNKGWINGYSNTRFGAVTPNGTNQTHLFYQGNQTADTAMPKTGTVSYNGTGLMVKNGVTSTNLQSQFTANFGTRQLSGTLKQNGATLYDIDANINGSSFSSKEGAKFETQGAFFGNNAEELAGAFNDTATNTKGVFGAKK